LDVEGIVLAGGQTRRGGVGEAHGIRGLTLAGRIGRAMAHEASMVTVLGDTPIEPFEFLADVPGHYGPMQALARFSPCQPYVFIASCNLVAFRSDVIRDLRNRIGTRAAAVPVASGARQALCALYRSESLDILRDMVRLGERSLEKWLLRINALDVDASCLATPAACFNLKMPVVHAKAAVKSSNSFAPTDSRR
jgi:molybdopterin-guanine dinucleotide biosynthesis protein A